MARRAEAPDAPRRAPLGNGGGGRRGGSDLTEGVPECTACGTCCFSELPEYVRVFGCDMDRMDERAALLTEFIGNRCYMRMEGGRCAALVIDPVERRFLCSIYEMRPDCCRALERGSGACRGELHTKSERPLLAVEALLKKSQGEPSPRSP